MVQWGWKFGRSLIGDERTDGWTPFTLLENADLPKPFFMNTCASVSNPTPALIEFPNQSCRDISS